MYKIYLREEGDVVNVKKEKLKGNEVRIMKENGITLIALVITIIVLLILAGVTINLTLGQNGIFKTAEQAARNYKEAEEKEVAELDKFDIKLEELQQQTTGNYKSLGTIVKTENGINYTADGVGNIIPVPVGFEPITGTEQGTKLTGFVIVNEDDNNEFVWVPVDGMSYSYDRYDFGKRDSSYSNYSEVLSSDESESLARYGGYYIGRYEAGIVDYTAKSTTADGTKIWTGYTGGTLVVQSDKEAWNYITREKAIEVATGLYNKEEDNVASKLCSSYAWDTALRFIETQNNGYATDSIQGNYSDKSEALGKPAKTGNTQAVNNIYDMGGNVWEWTTESYSNASFPYILRGGRYSFTSSERPASYRGCAMEKTANDYYGFRITMYL